MAHFFGAGGAVQVLTADPSAKLSEILPKKVIEANPFLKNMTAVDAKNWAARKMTVKSSDMGLIQSEIDEFDDTELRALASARLNEAIRARKRSLLLKRIGRGLGRRRRVSKRCPVIGCRKWQTSVVPTKFAAARTKVQPSDTKTEATALRTAWWSGM